MSKQYLLKISGLAALTLLFLSPAFAQDQQPHGDDKDTSTPSMDKMHNSEEIIIQRKNDKDVKVTIEVRDGQVLVNGKPVSEFNDDNISVRKKKALILDDNRLYPSGPGVVEDMADVKTLEIQDDRSPFRNHSGTQSLKAGNRAFLGVTSDNPENGGAGAEVKEISKGSAAEKAGLQPGDLITGIDGITISDPATLSDAVHKYKPENKVTITYKRDGKIVKTTAVLGRSNKLTRVYNYDYNAPRIEMDQQMIPIPPVPPMEVYPAYPNFAWGDGKPRLGIKAQDTEDGKGVKVLEVGDESAAEKAGIKEGDIITGFDGKEVNSAVTLADLARAGKDKGSFTVSLIRDGKKQEVEVKIPKKLKTANL